MDIKDFILIGGGLLIAAVIGHGFWIAWRARREPLRLDIAPDIIADDVDDIDRLRGELPNGGARVVTRDILGEQEMLELEAAPMLLEPTPPTTDRGPERKAASATSTSTQVRANEFVVSEPAVDNPGIPTRRMEPTAGAVEPRPKVAEVVVSDEPPPSEVGAEVGAEAGAAAEVRAELRTDRRADAPPKRPRRPAARKDTEKPVDPTPEQPPVEELIVMNVLARRGEPFTGDQLFAVLRGKGLKFGDMNVFHRVDPMTRKVNYSVANVVEPGTFDMADMEAFRSPGLCFFLQLPGPENPAQVFDDLVAVARDVATELGGELKDEQRSFMTPQTVEHYRQRIADFSRRRMSKRA